MQERAYEKAETLWPYSGFTVRASEKKLGMGNLTLTAQSLLFERKDGFAIGFGLPNLQLIRLRDVHSVELAYSLQGESRSALFRVLCTFPDGAEIEEIPSGDNPNDSYRGSLFRAVTGGVVARFLSDHASGTAEGLAKMTDKKFNLRMRDLETNFRLFPDKRQYEEDVWWDEALRKRSLEVAESEPQIWDDPFRDKLFYTGTNPSMTVDNAFEKLDILREDWVNGRISPLQRALCVAREYELDQLMSEMGYTDEQGGSSEAWRATAEKLLQFEKRVGVDVTSFS
jgi:hypothetical protein